MTETRFESLRRQLVSWYFILVPSLLMFTNIGERAYQDLVVVGMIVFALTRREWVSARPVLTIWILWALYAGWSLLTDSLGAGQFDGDWLIRTELALLLPVLVAWVLRVQFGELLHTGFRVALVLGAAASSYQVLYLGLGRAHGNENALIFAAAMSLYGLFVIHESIVRRSPWAWIWTVLTLTNVILSGSRGVVISVILALLMLAFLVPWRAFGRSVLLPLLVASVVTIGVADERIADRLAGLYQDIATTQQARGSLVDDFIAMDFVAPGAGAEGAPGIKPQYRSSFGYRMIYLRTGWEVFLQHPFTGVGSNNDMQHIGKALGIDAEKQLVHSHMHNAFLQDLVAGGIVKLALLIALLSYPLVYLARNGHRREFALLLIVSVNCIIFSITNMLFEITTITFIYTLILAYILGRLGFRPSPIPGLVRRWQDPRQDTRASE